MISRELENIEMHKIIYTTLRALIINFTLTLGILIKNITKMSTKL